MAWCSYVLYVPGTMANMVKQLDDYAPLPLKSFQKDINDLAFTSVSDLSGNPALMDKLFLVVGLTQALW